MSTCASSHPIAVLLQAQLPKGLHDTPLRHPRVCVLPMARHTGGAFVCHSVELRADGSPDCVEYNVPSVWGSKHT